MHTQIKSSRSSQVAAWAATSLFVLGFFFSPVGAWTGPVLGVWFAGTQKPRRGFLWMLAFSLIPSLIFGWRKFPLTGLQQALEYLGWMLLVSVLGVLPFTFHRLVSPRLPGFMATLPFPLAAAAIPLLALSLHISGIHEASLGRFFIHWLAATLVWMWTRESRATTLVFGLGIVLVAGIELTPSFMISVQHSTQPSGTVFGSICLGGALLLSIWALFHPVKQKTWADRVQTVAMLRSPFTGNPLHVAVEKHWEELVSSSGERFSVRDGIPTFLKPEDLTGDNGKYNHLYETIGGFYDDTQRFFCAFRGVEIDSYFENYMSLLQVKPGDSVLETSVGTGLNFKYLPRGVKLSGLDLSAEMLANCQANLRRWKMEADLYIGNAESLPFADDSFDAVFTCGGFNFFSDRAKAIREMIRVTKPGGQMMIEDETEEYVKGTYENIPYTSSFYSNRKEAVTVPIELVPTEMDEIHMEMLKDGKFYAITFRKPALAQSALRNTKPPGA
ncbi:MAG: class I SAM-dependent methyltransferase [Anaerolineaceae bacterium]|nr:class I SAM-dependent methyltransferase [Anaerolineaceae bacterium]